MCRPKRHGINALGKIVSGPLCHPLLNERLWWKMSCGGVGCHAFAAGPGWRESPKRARPRKHANPRRHAFAAHQPRTDVGRYCPAGKAWHPGGSSRDGCIFAAKTKNNKGLCEPFPLSPLHDLSFCRLNHRAGVVHEPTRRIGVDYASRLLARPRAMQRC